MAWVDVQLAAALFKDEIERGADGAKVTLTEREPAVRAEIVGKTRHGGTWREVWGISRYGATPSEMSSQVPDAKLERAIKRATKIVKGTAK